MAYDPYDLRTQLKEQGYNDEEITQMLYDEAHSGMGWGGKKPIQNGFEEEKIRNLLKIYNVEDDEIENFINDLKETKNDIEEDEEDDWGYLDSDTIAKLKATEKGKDLIINAPTMAKEELKKAIQEYLQSTE